MKDVKTEHLSAFQETWQGRLRKNRETGEFVRQPKIQLGKQKNQEFLQMFFRSARELRWIPENPAELLLSIKTPKIEVKKKTSEEKQRLLDAIPRVFPNIAQAATAFVLIQRYSGLRLVDVVTLRTDALREDGLMITSQEKKRATGVRAFAAVTQRAFRNPGRARNGCGRGTQSPLGENLDRG
jgi:integrase